MSTRTGKGRKRKPKGKPDNPAQSRRFIEAAKEMGLNDSKSFERALDKLLPKTKKRGNS